MMKTSIFKIANMHCSACAMTLEGMEDDVKGVKRVSASYAKQRMEVEFDPEILTERQIVAAVNELGYTVQAVL